MGEEFIMPPGDGEYGVRVCENGLEREVVGDAL
jgi:hypothetical protein